MEDFYIVIPSNVKNRSGTKNMTSSFTSYLPKPLTLDKHSWRVALVQIAYPYSWLNISGDVARVQIKKGTFEKEFEMIPFYYETPVHITGYINSMLKMNKFQSSLEMRSSGHCRITCKDHEQISFHPTLAGILGFDKTTFAYNEEEEEENERGSIVYNSVFKSDVRSSMFHMYIYSDIVSNTVVGDTYVPLLQTLPIRHHQRDTMIYEEFQIPHYMPLQTGSVPSITIKLCDETGNSIRFTRGHVVVKLHFKKYDGARTN